MDKIELPKLDSKTTEFLSSKDKSIDRARTIFGEDNVKEGSFRCKACGKLVPNSKIKIFNTKAVKGVVAYLCDDCWNYVKKEGGVFLVCMKCKEVRKVMEPFKNPVSGFEFKKGEVYHLEDCPVCNREKYYREDNQPVPMVIIEEAIYNRKLNQLKKEQSK